MSVIKKFQGRHSLEEVPGLVSAIVLSFNRKEETLQCLEALRHQTYPEVEIIVLENGSTDGSREALEQWAGRVGLIVKERNHGDWEGRDIALSDCRGEFVVIVDNDAIVPQNCFEGLVEALRCKENLGAVQPRIEDPVTGSPYDPGFGPESAGMRFYKAVFHGCVTMFRAEALKNAGGFPHYLLGGAEDYISLRFYHLGYKVLYEPSVVIRHLKSSKERTPFFRLQQQSRQKMRAKMALAPGLPFAMAIFARGVAAFVYHCLRAGHVLKVFPGIGAHVASGLLALKERTPLSPGAFSTYYRLKRRMTLPSEATHDGVGLGGR